MDLLPEDEPYELLHTREYAVRSYRKDATTMVLRGAVRDVKPAGLYVDDDRPLVVHHMVVELEVDCRSLAITAAHVLFEEHPHALCPGIVVHYDKLVGLNVARGFGAKVRELFGGPRGCTHITALLQAMAPVVNQSMFSMRAVSSRASGAAAIDPVGGAGGADRAAMFAGNLNTCHVWDEHGDHVAAMRAGQVEAPLWIRRRYEELGREWQSWGGPPGRS